MLRTFAYSLLRADLRTILHGVQRKVDLRYRALVGDSAYSTVDVLVRVDLCAVHGCGVSLQCECGVRSLTTSLRFRMQDRSSDQVWLMKTEVERRLDWARGQETCGEYDGVRLDQALSR